MAMTRNGLVARWNVALLCNVKTRGCVVFAACYSLVGNPVSSFADVIEYHPASSLAIGLGYDPGNPSDAHIVPCFSYASIGNKDTSGGTPLTAFTLTEVKNRQEMYNALGISASLDASYTFLSASGSTNIANEASFSDDSITYIATAKLDFGGFQPKDPKPIPELLKSTIAQVRAICGTQIVVQEDRGASASIIFTFEHISASDKQSMQTAVAASASFFSGGGSLQSNYNQSFESANENSNLHVEIEVQGGPGKDFLAGAAVAGGDLAKIKSLLADYLHKATEANAKPLSYVTGSVTQFGYKGSPVVTANRDAFLEQSLFQYEDLKNVVDRINQITISPNTSDQEYLNSFVSDTERQALGALAQKYQQRMNAITSSVKSCAEKGKSCVTVGITDLPRVDWPKFPDHLRIVPAWICNFARGAPVPGHTPPMTLGTTGYAVVIVGDKNIFDSLYKIDNGIKVPMHAMLGNGYYAYWTGALNCKQYHPDTTQVFASFTDSEELKWPVQHPSVEYHVIDKFGRNVTFVPDWPDVPTATMN